MVSREEKLKKMKEYSEKNKDAIANRKKIYYATNKSIILKQQKERYNKIKIIRSNKGYNIDIDERKKRINARAYARKKPMKEECQICYSPERLERHHWDYNKPLVFATLCNFCHNSQHVKNFGGGI